MFTTSWIEGFVSVIKVLFVMLLSFQASIVEVTIKISHKQHNAIIGPKGKLIHSVMEECGGVRIHFPPR